MIDRIPSGVCSNDGHPAWLAIDAESKTGWSMHCERGDYFRIPHSRTDLIAFIQGRGGVVKERKVKAA